uniref:Uncharacterized protein n=1 Tax=Peronospora matthiolae TaxID=2874970 RepID=A0AAV1VKA6_9STRA
MAACALPIVKYPIGTTSWSLTSAQVRTTTVKSHSQEEKKVRDAMAACALPIVKYPIGTTSWSLTSAQVRTDDGEIPFSGGEESTGLSMPIRVTISVIAGLNVALLLVFATWGGRRLSKCRSIVQRGINEMDT